MNLILFGMSHKTSPLEAREKLALRCGEAGESSTGILGIPGVKEAMCLFTCNRCEIIAVGDSPEAADGIRDFIADTGEFSAEDLDRFIYVHRGGDAVRHLFRVASSLDSMVPGEPQILGQVKEAYRQCVDRKSSGMLLNRLLHHAFRTAKRVRTETGIAENAVSVSFAAIELAKKIFGSLNGKTVLLVGAGEMAELAARHLAANGAGKIFIANRTYENAVRLSREFLGSPVEYGNIGEKLGEADIVISSTGASGYQITKDMVAAALRRRKNRLLFLIDIAVPRDVDPAAAQIDNVYLYNVDDLQGIVDENVKTRVAETGRAESIVAEEVSLFAQWYDSLEAVPTIVDLRRKLEEIADGEIGKSSWLRELGPEENEKIRQLVGSVLNKILHGPVTGLKEASRNSGALPYIEAVRKLFKLDDSSSEFRVSSSEFEENAEEVKGEPAGSAASGRSESREDN
ncbi:MAG TPA: glutamyl-tRNA reductase [Syntrophales bacterium]|nr:glutamyl-tRNA reductase [Syntrophales bacterium]